MNYIYQKVAIFVSYYENFRTQSEYDWHIYGRIFVFQFVNSFAALYYIAFVQQYVEPSDPSDSIVQDVMLHLFVLLLSFICFNAVEIGAPIIIKWKAQAEQESDEKTELET